MTPPTSEMENSQAGTGGAVRTHDHVLKVRVHSVEKVQQLVFTLQNSSVSDTLR